MDQEVAKTLAELELKLRELERELASIGRRAAEPAPPTPEPPPAPRQPPPFRPQPPSLGTPPIHPRQPPAGPPPPGPPPISPLPPPATPPPGRLVDEAAGRLAERRYSMEAQETAFGEIPATRDEHGEIDLGELVMFREKMQHTLQGLIDEYSRLLSQRPGP